MANKRLCGSSATIRPDLRVFRGVCICIPRPCQDAVLFLGLSTQSSLFAATTALLVVYRYAHVLLVLLLLLLLDLFVLVSHGSPFMAAI
jgi:hypothetical protein